MPRVYGFAILEEQDTHVTII
ncbi:hypothetical protein EYZ11_001340 [Aspergillus tanneri]|uniref:Uncharacterized protein n=1 Tax=Aspergillus tanneri TaxID=1220188 RepID=A0A4S3JUU2_9EURO|nr:hypothetical protein EYZ11_001340 [Aspergillus tanneri]